MGSQFLSTATPAIPLFPAAVLLGILCIAAFTDIRARRIPNHLIFWGLACALLIALSLGGSAALNALVGIFAALFVFFPVYLWGALGAGDVKLLMVVGAFLGTQQLLFATLLIFLSGGVLALLYSRLMYRLDNKPNLPYAVSILAGVASHFVIHF